MPFPVRVENGVAYASQDLCKLTKRTTDCRYKLTGESYIRSDLDYVLYAHKLSTLNMHQPEENASRWAEVSLSLQYYKPDIQWIKEIAEEHFDGIEFFIKRIGEHYSKSEVDAIIAEIIHRPEKGWYQYMLDCMITGGIGAVIQFMVNIQNHSLDTNAVLMCLNDKTASNIFRDTIDLGYGQNKYVFNNGEISDWWKHQDSLIDKFLIRTSGFNQCFAYDGEHYSSVAVRKRKIPIKDQYEQDFGLPRTVNTTDEYYVYIYGCDDSSYTRYGLDSLEKAEMLCRHLTRIEPVVYLPHLTKLGFEFTN